MACYQFEQYLYSAITSPSVSWKKDLVLQAPLLYAPEDDAIICPDNYPWTKGSASGIELSWDAVSGATKYIVQWCKNASFTGPSLRAVIVATTEYELLLSTDIRQGDGIHWRVMAIDENGGVSQNSETRFIQYECLTPQPGRGGGSGKGNREDLCDVFQVKVEVRTSAEIALACETIFAACRFSYACKDEDENPIISLTDLTWETFGDPDHAGEVTHAIVAGTNGRLIRIDLNCTENQEVTVRATLTFLHIPTGVSFICVGEKTFLVDSKFGWYMYKPWGSLISASYDLIYTVDMDDYFVDLNNRQGANYVPTLS